MTKQYWQDSVTIKQAKYMAAQALGDIRYMYRYHSENNQVYSFHDSENRFWIMKIAGKEDYQRDGLLTEITCVRQLKKLGLPVADIFYTHEDITDAVQLFFIMPYLGKATRSWEHKPKILAKIMKASGRFVKLLSEIDGECFTSGVLMDKKTTLEYFNAECRDNTAYLKSNGLWNDAVKNCMDWAGEMYNRELFIGQSQASEPLIDSDGNIHFIDFEGGLNYTHPLKSLECITHYVEDEKEYTIAKKALIDGFYGDNAGDFEEEWTRWRQYK